MHRPTVVGSAVPSAARLAVPRPCSLHFRGFGQRSGTDTKLKAVKEERKTASGRKGDTERPATTGGRKTTSGRTASPSPPPSRAASPAPRRAAPQNQPTGQPRPGTSGRKASGGKPGGPLPSQLDAYVRKHPLFSRFYNTTLLLGDCVMILATEASSERIEWSSFPALVAVLLVSWVAAGAWNGDYSPRGTRAHEDVPWQLALLGGPTFGAVMGAALTWAAASTASVAAYSALVSRAALDAAPLVEDLNTEDLSPQLEVVVALLVTMTCWRGIESRLRPPPSET